MALVTRYVNTASSTGGDGTTNGTTGATRAYVSISEWNSAEATNLVSDGDSHLCYFSGSTVDSSQQTDTNNWTTGASNTLTLEGHPSSGSGANPTGIWSTSYYRNVSTGGSYTIKLSDSHITLRNLQFEHTSTKLLDANTSGTDCVLDSCIFQCGSTNSDIIKGRARMLIINSILDGQGDSQTCLSSEGADIEVYNTVLTAADEGVDCNAHTTLIVKNCAVFNNTDDFVAVHASTTIDYCASDDGDGTNSVDISPGGTEADGWAAAFTSYTTYDYSPKDASSVLVSAGLGSATDPNVPTEDLIGTTRSTSAPSIGAIEFVGTVTFIPTLTIY